MTTSALRSPSRWPCAARACARAHVRCSGVSGCWWSPSCAATRWCWTGRRTRHSRGSGHAVASRRRRCPLPRPPLQHWCASFTDPGQRASTCRGWTCADDPRRVYRLRCGCPVCVSCPCVRCPSAVCSTSVANGVTSAFGSAPVKEVLSRRERSDFCLLAAHPSRRILSDAADGVISALGLPLPLGNSSIGVTLAPAYGVTSASRRRTRFLQANGHTPRNLVCPLSSVLAILSAHDCVFFCLRVFPVCHVCHACVSGFLGHHLHPIVSAR